MPIIFQQIVGADSKYSFSNDPSNVLFDIHNDSPYNMGVSFGRDVGISGCDIYTSPQSILFGIPVPGGKYRVGGSRFNGQIYLYTQTPLGGTTSFSSSPAQSITVLGYPVGSNPQGTTSLNRLANVGNSLPVTTTSSATSTVNDGSAAGTTLVESTPTGKPQAVLLTNDAQMTLGDTTNYGATLTVNGGTHLASTFTAALDVYNNPLTVHAGSVNLDNNNAIQIKDSAGTLHPVLRGSNTNVTVLGSLGGTIDFVSLTQQIYSFAANGGSILFNNAGLSLQVSGGFTPLTSSGSNTYIDGTNSSVMRANGANIAIASPGGFAVFQKLNLSGAGSITGITVFSGTLVASGTVTVNHGMSVTPDDCIITIKTTSGSTTHSETWTATQCSIFNGSAATFAFVGYAYKL